MGRSRFSSAVRQNCISAIVTSRYLIFAYRVTAAIATLGNDNAKVFGGNCKHSDGLLRFQMDGGNEISVIVCIDVTHV